MTSNQMKFTIREIAKWHGNHLVDDVEKQMGCLVETNGDLLDARGSKGLLRARFDLTDGCVKKW